MPNLRLAALAAVLLAGAAAARPPALLWSASPEPPRSHAVLLVERDASSVRLLSARLVGAPPKLRPRAPDGGGLVSVVRDAEGRPLAITESFGGSLHVHGDEPDDATGTLRSLSAELPRTAFPLRVPLPPGAWDVAVYEQPAGRTSPPAIDELREGRSLALLGVLPIPRP